MGVCGSKSVDSASDSSDSDSEEPSRKPSHQHGVTVAKSEVCVQGTFTALGIRSLIMSRSSCKALFWEHTPVFAGLYKDSYPAVPCAAIWA